MYAKQICLFRRNFYFDVLKMGLNLLPEIYQDQQLTSIDPIINFTTINPLDQLSIASF